MEVQLGRAASQPRAMGFLETVCTPFDLNEVARI
jgi:hypothetical protein